jgi:uncharacterized protein YqfA (UPF0365 family)
MWHFFSLYVIIFLKIKIYKGGLIMPYIPIIPIIIVVLLILLFAFVPMRLWITALASGSHVGIGTLIGMRLRKVPPARIVLPLIQARKAGLQLNTNQLESHYMAGGHVDAVVNALIASSRAGMNIPFEMAAAIDLAGRDVLEAVRMSVNPKVIETPNISAVAKDGIELLVKARVTVRTNINQLVGGAGEATVIARVGEGIVTTVGSADSHKSVLENPDSISKAILQKGLDIGTAFQILSIDIADVDIGRNIGAHLQSLQAEADKNIAQAKAEAVALEQEMKASVVAAEAEVPKALAEALRTGRMGFKDYYDLQNLKADTKMRQSIAGETEKPATI